MPGINSVEYPVQGNRCGVVVGKNDLKKPLKHMIHTYYQVWSVQTTTTTPIIWTAVATPAIQTTTTE